MSGIVGLWNLDGRPVDSAVFGAMSDALRHRGRDGRREIIAGSVGLAHHHLWVTPEEVGERQPLAGGRGTLLALDGRVDNRDELIARLDLPRTASDAACVLWAYQAWGEAALERLKTNKPQAPAPYKPVPKPVEAAAPAAEAEGAEAAVEETAAAE